jgi:hypothetical protein
MMQIKISATRVAVIVAIAGPLCAGNMARADDSVERAAQSTQRASMAQLLRPGGLRQLAPCKSAAARHCDRSGGLTTSNLRRCGTVLAAISDQVGNQCRKVLQRYGQI